MVEQAAKGGGLNGIAGGGIGKDIGHFGCSFMAWTRRHG
jgi:hypothetical protein